MQRALVLAALVLTAPWRPLGSQSPPGVSPAGCSSRRDSLPAYRRDAGGATERVDKAIAARWVTYQGPDAQVTYVHAGASVLRAVVLTWATGDLVQLAFFPAGDLGDDPLAYLKWHRYQPAVGGDAHQRQDSSDPVGAPVPDADRDVAMRQLRAALAVCRPETSGRGAT